MHPSCQGPLARLITRPTNHLAVVLVAARGAGHPPRISACAVLSRSAEDCGDAAGHSGQSGQGGEEWRLPQIVAELRELGSDGAVEAAQVFEVVLLIRGVGDGDVDAGEALLCIAPRAEAPLLEEGGK